LTTSGVIATLIKYFIFLIFVQAAANVLGIPQLTEIINRIILFIPNVVIAMAIIVIGALIARFLSGLVRSSVSELGVGNPNLLATLTQYVVIGFAVIAAIDQLGIAATLVNTLLIGLIGSVALAFGLAFGLGGRDAAKEITQKWYEGSQSLVEAAKQRADAGGTSTRGGAQVFRGNPPVTRD
ncbi:MAG: small-conductance mechanosensitive ion channel, partial [Acidobacteriota bacterium]|nr:small-conductance mechanosensitive ion channel [Acidobacteriota bacterium]